MFGLPSKAKRPPAAGAGGFLARARARAKARSRPVEPQAALVPEPAPVVALVVEPVVGLSEVELQLQAAGMELLGHCTDLSARAVQWRHGSALLEDLSEAELAVLGSVMPMVRAQPGQTLIAEGALGDWMLLLLSGTVDVVKDAEEGERSRLAVIKEGASIGEMSMLDASPRYASCVAIEEVQAAVLTRAAVGRLIDEHPVVSSKLLVKLTQMLAQRLRNTSNQMIKLLQKQ